MLFGRAPLQRRQVLKFILICVVDLYAYLPISIFQTLTNALVAVITAMSILTARTQRVAFIVLVLPVTLEMESAALVCTQTNHHFHLQITFHP